MTWWTHAVGVKACSVVGFQPVETQQGSVHTFYNAQIIRGLEIDGVGQIDGPTVVKIEYDGWNKSSDAERWGEVGRKSNKTIVFL